MYRQRFLLERDRKVCAFIKSEWNENEECWRLWANRPQRDENMSFKCESGSGKLVAEENIRRVWTSESTGGSIMFSITKLSTTPWISFPHTLIVTSPHCSLLFCSAVVAPDHSQVLFTYSSRYWPNNSQWYIWKHNLQYVAHEDD